MVIDKKGKKTKQKIIKENEEIRMGFQLRIEQLTKFQSGVLRKESHRSLKPS